MRPLHGVLCTVRPWKKSDAESLVFHADNVNVTRPDVVRPSLSPEDALSGAPEAEQQRFAVPRILDED